MSNYNKTDGYFRDKLAGFEQSPPESAWENIAGRIGQKRKKRMLVLIFRIAAGMAILLSTGLGVYLITREQPQTSDPTLTSITDATRMDRTQKNNLSSDPTVTGTSDDVNNLNSVPTLTGPTNVVNNINTVPTLTGPTDAVNNINTVPTLTGPTDVVNNINTVPTLTGPTDAVRMEQGPFYADRMDHMARIEGRVENSDLEMQDLETQGRAPVQLTEEEATALLLADYYGNSDNPESKNDHWSMGSEVAPLYSYRAITSDNYQQVSARQFNESESGVLAYAGGIRVNYSAGRRFSVQSGIYYSRYGQQKEGNAISANTIQGNNYSFVQVTNSTGTIRGVADNKRSYYSASPVQDQLIENFSNSDSKVGISNANLYPVVTDNASNINFEQVFDYFELPLIMKYKIIDRKMDFSFNGGLVTNFLFGNSLNMVNDGKTTRVTETTEINEINYLGSFGLGLDYPVSPRFDITLEPRFRYFINPIGTSSEIIVHPFSFGFFAGFNYRF